MYEPPFRRRPTLTSLDPFDGCDSWLPLPTRVLVHFPAVLRSSTKTPSHAASTISSRWSPFRSMSWRLWIVCSELSATSTGQSASVGLLGDVVDQDANPLPCPPVRALGAAALQRRRRPVAACPSPAPSPSPSGGGAASAPRSGSGGPASGLSASRPSHWSVLGFFVSGGRQPAPSAKSIRPSPSMSCGWMQTLSRAVALRMMSCFAQPGFSYQTTASSVTATTSGLRSPLTSATVTA